jgi:hypothetical protein
MITPAPIGVQVAGVALAASAACSQCVEEYRFTPEDSQRLSLVGGAVAVSDDRVVVGAYGDSDGSGCAYLYDAQTGGLVAKLRAPSPEPGEYFGFKLALEDGLVFVGALYDSDMGYDAGSVTIFDAATGTMVSALYASDAGPGQAFGRSVAADGSLLLVGSFDGVYTFDVSDPSNPIELAKFDVGGLGFGHNIAVRSGRAVISVGSVWDPVAFLFDVTDPAHPRLTAQLDLHNDAYGWYHRHGTRVGISDRLAIVGTYSLDYGDSSGSTASLFDVLTGEQVGTLRPGSDGPDDLFGLCVAISGNIAAVSNWAYTRPRVHLFDVTNPAQPVEIARLTLPDEPLGFGDAIAIHRQRIVIGAPEGDGATEESGLAVLYDLGGCGLCPGDWDHNGALDSRDVLAFLGAWAGDDPSADFNRDGDIDTRDFLAYLGAWASGC